MSRSRLGRAVLLALLVVGLPSVARAGDTALVHSDWESLGGELAGKPSVAAWSEGRLDVFIRGLDDQLWHKWHTGGQWSPWESLGAPAPPVGTGLASDPGAVSWEAGHLDVYVKGKDGQLWHKWYLGGQWSGWEPLGGQLTSAPAAASWQPGRLDVFVRGTDGQLWHRWYERGWSWWEPLGGVLVGGPATDSWGPGRYDVFVRGTDNQVWQRYYAGGWSPWLPQGGQASADPAVASWGPNRLDLYIRKTDNRVARKFYAGGWTGYAPIGNVTATSAPAAVSWAPNRLDVFARGEDGTLLHSWTFNSVSAGDGSYRVGSDIAATTYRTRQLPPGGACSYSRRAGAGGDGDVVAGGITTSIAIVTVAATDKYFVTQGCGKWTTDLSALTASPTANFPDGTWFVGKDVAPGTWQAPGGDDCYWARVSGFRHDAGEVLDDALGEATPSVALQPGDAGFHSEGCGTWQRIG